MTTNHRNYFLRPLRVLNAVRDPSKDPAATGKPNYK
jgi:hypothetical protein